MRNKNKIKLEIIDPECLIYIGRKLWYTILYTKQKAGFSMKRILSLALLMITVFMIASPVFAPEADAAAKVKIFYVNTKGVRFRSEPYGYNDANIIKTLKKGTMCIQLSGKGNWYRVATEDGETGWVFNRYLTYYGAAEKKTIGLCTGNRVPVYKTYSTKSRMLGRLNENDIVIVRRYNDTWAEITTLKGGTIGYTSIKSLKRAF